MATGDCKYCGERLLHIPVKEGVYDETFKHFAKALVCPVCDLCGPRTKPNLPRPNAKSLRCDYCETLWPLFYEYLECPRCKEPTRESWQESIDWDRADSIALECRFGWWLVARWLDGVVT